MGTHKLPLSFANARLLLSDPQIVETMANPTVLAGLRLCADMCRSASEDRGRWPGGSKIPSIVAAREACEFDGKRFAETFFPHDCRVGFSPMHEAMFTTNDRHMRLGERGWREATAAPRGGGKSTIQAKIELVRALLYGYEQYVVIISANKQLALDKVKEVRDCLTDNARLIEAFGPQQTREWRQTSFVTHGGAKVMALTPGSAGRGILWKGVRPTLILLDDAETDETVLTEFQRQRFEDWFFNVVSKLGDEHTNIRVIGTILHPESLLQHLLKNPGYTGTKYTAVERFADTTESLALWQEWRRLLLTLDNPNRLEEARDFYVRHEAAMIQGSRVLWPDKESYYALMLQRLIEGESSFWKEKQNTPLGDSRYIFQMEDAAYCTVRPDGILRHDLSLVPWSDIPEIVAYWDPTPDKQRAAGTDFAACAVVARDIHGYMYLVDMYLRQEVSTDVQMNSIAELLAYWQAQVLGMEANNFQGLLKGQMQEKLTALYADLGLGTPPPIWAITNTRNKHVRIQSLEALIANHWLQFSRTLPAACYVQFGDFLPGQTGNHDDAMDACEGSIRVVKGLIDRRSAEAA